MVFFPRSDHARIMSGLMRGQWTRPSKTPQHGWHEIERKGEIPRMLPRCSALKADQLPASLFSTFFRLVPTFLTAFLMDAADLPDYFAALTDLVVLPPGHECPRLLFLCGHSPILTCARSRVAPLSPTATRAPLRIWYDWSRSIADYKVTHAACSAAIAREWWRWSWRNYM